ncbi:MAG: outer membrane protein assembly factor BamA [Ignavibacteria bacterium]|nr:outer membrane protein assembly factor BamA [Ignavibacteria bacterium]MBK9405087.1 outer membrane protein assembly factor BamA [Ignavibacteria bacterium]MBL0106846.1 outer membrane protein assembly factor BamA [Ignavibacteria bacterium]
MTFKKAGLKLSLISIILFSLISGKTFSQNDGPTTYRIASINTKGNKNYETNTIISYSGLNIGQEITIPSDQTKEALERLWNIGIFSDVKIYLEKKFGNDAYLVIEVEELPRVEKVEISGNDEFSNDDLKEYINVVNGEVISDQKLKDIEYNLEKYYADEGYGLADVKVDKLVSSGNEARIRVKINEGEKLSVNKITFEGNKNISSDDLKSALEETTEDVWWKFWQGSTFDKQKFEADKKFIENLYREKGYRDAVVLTDKLEILPSKTDVNIKVTVDEGKKYYVNDIKFEGNKLYDSRFLESKLGLKKGDVYNTKKLKENIYGNESESDISSMYLDNGYLSFNADINEIPAGENKIDLNIKITEASQFKFGLVGFEGNDKTQDKVLRREVYTIPGDYFNKSNIKRSMQQLAALNYFNPEKLTQDISLSNDSVVNIKYIVEEKSSDQFNASIGYSGSFGITGSLGLTFNNFDIAAPFSGGAGQILTFNWSFGTGGTYRTFDIGFQEPWLYNTPTQLGFNIFDTRQNYSNLELKETGASVNIGKRFKFPDDYFRGDWTAKFQRTDVINGDEIYQEGVRNQFSIRQIISRSSVFEPVFPTGGTKVSNSTELSGGPFLPGSVDFIKNIFSAEAYTPVSINRKLVLYSNFQFSFVNSFAKDKYLPPNETFYMGGNGLTYNTISLRGYEDRSIGPVNRTGNPIGGRVAVKYGLELRYSLSQDPLPIFIVAFAEAGNVWADISKTDPFDLRRSAGFGTRLVLPAVGLVGFDFGYGFDRRIVDAQSPKWQFHFQFGKGF